MRKLKKQINNVCCACYVDVDEALRTWIDSLLFLAVAHNADDGNDGDEDNEGDDEGNPPQVSLSCNYSNAR